MLVGFSCILFLVPSMRLELTRLSALPPQDSVSTNSTTTATNKKLYRAFFYSTSVFGCSLNPMHRLEQARKTVLAHQPPVLPACSCPAPELLPVTEPRQAPLAMSMRLTQEPQVRPEPAPPACW